MHFSSNYLFSPFHLRIGVRFDQGIYCHSSEAEWELFKSSILEVKKLKSTGTLLRVKSWARAQPRCSAHPEPFWDITLWSHDGSSIAGLAALETMGARGYPWLIMNFNKMSYEDVSNSRALLNSISKICLVMRIIWGTCQKLKSPGSFPDPVNQPFRGEGPGRLNF